MTRGSGFILGIAWCPSEVICRFNACVRWRVAVRSSDEFEIGNKYGRYEFQYGLSLSGAKRAHEPLP